LIDLACADRLRSAIEKMAKAPKSRLDSRISQIAKEDERRQKELTSLEAKELKSLEDFLLTEVCCD